MPGRGALRAAGGKNVETPHPVETSHAYSVFISAGCKVSTLTGRQGSDGRIATWHTVLKGTTPPLS